MTELASANTISSNFDERKITLAAGDLERIYSGKNSERKEQNSAKMRNAERVALSNECDARSDEAGELRVCRTKSAMVSFIGRFTRPSISITWLAHESLGTWDENKRSQSYANMLDLETWLNMLQKEYFVAKDSFNSAVNEPSKI